MLNHKRLWVIVLFFLLLLFIGLKWILLPKATIQKSSVASSESQPSKKSYQESTEVVIASKADSTRGVEDKAFSDFVNRNIDELITELQARHNLSGIVYDAVPDSQWDNYFDKLEAANSMDEFEILLNDSYNVSQSKHPASGVVVTVSSGEFTATQVTDADGKYEFIGLPEGPFSISCEKTVFPAGTKDNRTASAKTQIRLDCNQGINLDLQTDNIILRGRIVDTKGDPISGAGVYGTTGPFSNSDDVEASKPKQFRVVSQSDGSYELSGVEPVNFLSAWRYLFLGQSNGEDSCITITATDKQGKQGKGIQVPRLTDQILYKGRRLNMAYNEVAQRSGRDSLIEHEAIMHLLPKSTGNIITVPDMTIE
jgi:hypothetical protein